MKILWYVYSQTAIQTTYDKKYNKQKYDNKIKYLWFRYVQLNFHIMKMSFRKYPFL